MVGQVTASDVPVGVGGTAPTGDPATRFPAHYRNGHDAVQLETYRRRCDELIRTVEVLLSALDGGEEWEIDNARLLARRELDHIKDDR